MCNENKYCIFSTSHLVYVHLTSALLGHALLVWLKGHQHHGRASLISSCHINQFSVLLDLRRFLALLSYFLHLAHKLSNI